MTSGADVAGSTSDVYFRNATLRWQRWRLNGCSYFTDWYIVDARSPTTKNPVTLSSLCVIDEKGSRG